MNRDTPPSALERRWRLVLGAEADNLPLAPADAALDRTLGALYDQQRGRDSLHGSAPGEAWLVHTRANISPHT